MKKITLSATVLALTMMGCSDSGLDNSVASTSEVKSDQVLPLDDISVALMKTTESCDNFDISCATYQTIGSHTYNMYFNSGVDGMNQGFGRASVWRDNEPYIVADFVHIISACVQGCDDYGNCQYYAPLEMKSRPRVSFLNSAQLGVYSPGMEARCSALSSEHGKVGVVSVYSIVFDAGKSSEVILTGATRVNLSYNQGLWVYQKYILPAQLNQAGL